MKKLFNAVLLPLAAMAQKITSCTPLALKKA